MSDFITLTESNINSEHICCAISDKKVRQSYDAKKEWLKKEFQNGYVFRRLNERAKVFIEYGPAELAWLPITAPNFLNINCFWVSGKYKKSGYGKTLLQSAMDDANAQQRDGLVTVVGSKKFHFMSDTKWLLRQGFEECDRTESGFSLLVKKLNSTGTSPTFKESAKQSICNPPTGLVAYYSNRCPFAEFHALESLKESAEKRNLPLTTIKLTTLQEAQNAPSPATIFSLFYNGKFVTTDVSVCMDSRFDKIVGTSN
jgi:hypothetical protein